MASIDWKIGGGSASSAGAPDSSRALSPQQSYTKTVVTSRNPSTSQTSTRTSRGGTASSYIGPSSYSKTTSVSYQPEASASPNPFAGAQSYAEPAASNLNANGAMDIRDESMSEQSVAPVYDGLGRTVSYAPAFNLGESDGGIESGSGVPLFNLGTSGGADASGSGAIDARRNELMSRIGTIRDTVNKVPGASRPKLSSAPDFAKQMEDAARSAQIPDSNIPDSPEGQDAQDEPSGRYDAFFASGAGGRFRQKYGDRAQGVLEKAEDDVAKALGIV